MYFTEIIQKFCKKNRLCTLSSRKYFVPLYFQIVNYKKINMKRTFTFFLSLVLFTNLTIFAAIPSGYYTAADNKKGAALLSALHGCIDGHTTLSYSSLENYYDDTDLTAEGYIWDMYSTCEFTLSDNSGSNGVVCGMWNKEHSIPQSWFGEASPMKSDLFHVYPTDARVNNARSNYPFGETSNRSAIASSPKALGYLGTSNFSGYSGTVFEPVDQYKGDFARTYFYMVARYLDKNFNQSENGKVVFTYSSSTTGLTTYAVNLFLKWHRQDPVSQKEIDRNNAVYKHQKNRNPFIDYPYLAEYIWGERKNETMVLEELMSSSDPDFVPGESDGSREEVVRTPELSVNTTSVNFPSVMEGERTTYSIKVTGIHLTTNVTLTIAGEDADFFTVSPSSLTIAAVNSSSTNNNVTLTYAPTEKGQHTATLQITSAGAETLSVKLYGTCNASCNVTWMVNGEEYTTGNPTISLAAGSKVTTLPTAPKSCDEISNQFVGWSEEVITTAQDEVPTDLFSDASDASAVSHDVVYHAVFAALEEREVEVEQPASISMNLTNTEGWTLFGLIEDSKHWRVVTNAYIESPQVDLANITSIVVNLRTYGGATNKTLEFSMNDTKVGQIDATTNKLKDYTWTPTSTMSGSGKLRFSSTTNSAENGPALSSITINQKTGPSVEYVYSRYITSCNNETTDIEETVVEKTNTKIIRNGQLLIEYNGVYYNTLGQPTKQ